MATGPRQRRYRDKTCDLDCWLQSYSPQDPPPSAKPAYHPESFQPSASTIYQPLKDWQTRILRLEPGNPKDEVVTRLHVASVVRRPGVVLEETSEIVKYEALSYSWGYGGNEAIIQCNGTTLVILESLYSALQWLRYTDRVRFLWIDAISINQADLNEKSAQIRRMFETYFRAERVIAWLGQYHECGDQALRYLTTFSPTLRHRPSCQAGLGHVLKGMETLCARPWWFRTWVRQEVFAARQLVLQVGDQTVDWEHFKAQHTQFWEWFSLNKRYLPGSLSAPTNMERIRLAPDNLVRSTREDAAFLALQEDNGLSSAEPRFSLDAVLRGSVNFEASNARDFVYGIISMTAVATCTSNDSIKEEGPPVLEISYDIPTDEVFMKTTDYLIRSHQSLDVIFLASETQSANTLLPSWCPDWGNLDATPYLDRVWCFQDGEVAAKDSNTFKDGRDIFLRGRTRLGSSCYNNAGPVRDLLYKPLSNWHGTNSKHLKRRGTFLGTLSLPAKSRSIPRQRQDKETIQNLVDWLEDIKGLKKASFYPSNDRRDKNIHVPSRPFGMDRWFHTGYRSTHQVRESLADLPCFVPDKAQHQDQVVLIDGCTLPAILRPVGDDTRHFTLVGAFISLNYILNENDRARWALWKLVASRMDEFSLDVPTVRPLIENLPTKKYVIV